MFKKAILCVIALTAITIGNAFAADNWIIHPTFVGSSATNLVDAGDFVYYLSSGNLFRYDKTTSENEHLNKLNLLSDATVTKIFYNYSKEYLVVAYENSNIDVLLSNGSVVNMPEIKDAVLTTSKTINDVTFYTGKMYVATAFGFVVIDDNKWVVSESFNLGQTVNSVAQMGDLLLLSYGAYIYYGAVGNHYTTINSFKHTGGNSSGKFYPIDDTHYFLSYSGKLNYYTITNASVSSFKQSATTIASATATNVQKFQDKYIANFMSSGYYYLIGADGTAEKVTADNELYSSHSDGTIWAVGANGLHIKGSETYYMPNGLTISQPFYLNYNSSLGKMYVSTPGLNGFFSSQTAPAVNCYDGTTWSNVTPTTTGGCTFWMITDPSNPNIYYLSSWKLGLFRITNDKLNYTYALANSPMLAKSSVCHPVHSIDRHGNLWVLQPYENSTAPIMALPASKRINTTVKKSDWVKPSLSAFYTGKTQQSVFTSTFHARKNVQIFTDGGYSHPIMFFSCTSPSALTSDSLRTYSQFVDQEGSPFTWTYTYACTEDHNGDVWMGFTEGIISFDPDEAFNSDFRVNRIKVPRNDGTNLADYLLDGIQVNCIAVDNANRKWIGTHTNGVFLVSADGSEIINQFNTSNSPLASNMIYRIACNTDNNSVFITTSKGLYEYRSDATVAATSYSDVYAYPNPVRPDYTGLITITGLMDNSLIKIADSAGNVITQFKSSGGEATWNGYDQTGTRAKTGVYYVIVSHAGGDEKVVTKIAIIR